MASHPNALSRNDYKDGRSEGGGGSTTFKIPHISLRQADEFNFMTIIPLKCRLLEGKVYDLDFKTFSEEILHSK